jgi:hypothetical protein
MNLYAKIQKGAGSRLGFERLNECLHIVPVAQRSRKSESTVLCARGCLSRLGSN